VILILVGIFVLEQGAQVFAPVAEIAGLSTEYAKEVAVIPPTLYNVQAANYTFAAEDVEGGRQYEGSLTVAGGREVGFYVMDAGNFTLWRAGQPASLTVDNPNAISYNFTLSPPSSGSYYFIFENQESSPLVVVFSLSSLQYVTVLNPLVGYAGYELLLLGIVFSLLGISGGGRKRAEAKRAVRTVESGWKCKFCDARNPGNEQFCGKCGRAQS